MLEISHLTKKFGKKEVLRDFSFSFQKGVYGLLGPNGAGKTTLMRCITKLYPLKDAAISFEGKPIQKDDGYLSHIGYLPQKFGVFKDLKVTEMLQLLANLKGIDKAAAAPMIEQALKRVNLSDRAHSKVGALSGGMVRRLGVAQALLNEPDIIIFDEPTAGLDPEERLRFKSIVAEMKGERLILISTHIVEDVEAVCDHVAVMKDGRIIDSGTCAEIQEKARGKVFEIPETQLPQMQGKVEIQKHYEKNGIRMLKLLSGEPQDAEPCTPNVEDGYICVLNNI